MESKQNPNSLVLEDRYELIEIIGEGGMAVVYKALDRRLNRFVAVKIMRPEMAQEEEFRKRFFAGFASGNGALIRRRILRSSRSCFCSLFLSSFVSSLRGVS